MHIPASKHERRVGFHAEAPFAKHDYRFRSRDVIRMAGSVWSESPEEHTRKLQREREVERTKHSPVGLGFANRDSFGPDDTFRSVSGLNNIRAPEDYMPQKIPGPYSQF
jgi:hypothetical protein